MSKMTQIRIGIDTGGTFTDVVAFDKGSGTLVTTKTPSTPSNPADGFVAGIEKILEILNLSGDAIEAVSHGTTVGTNQLLEEDIENLGFITNAGYESMLEIARQSVPDGYGNSYFWVKPDRIVPRHLVRGVPGRLDVDGKEIEELDEEATREVVRWFKKKGISTLGVSLLHSYANPVHEEQVRDIIAEEYPEAIVSISSQVLREYREYERSMTTLVDAAVKPNLSRYVQSVRAQLQDLVGEGRSLPFYVMKSNGGVLSAEEVVHQPITTVLSGPAAGALGAALMSRQAGFDRVLTLDGGGTSTDVTVVIDGEPSLTTEGSVGAYPTKIPMIDVVTVGAGGGSIAALAPDGTMKVGPRSAGAVPGPICYGAGGTDVTVTDAHVFLGRIPPHLLGGEIPLDVSSAGSAIEELAASLGLSPEACATGILEISAWHQANALRQITVKRGLDVRDFALTTFGGSGSLLLCQLMDILGISTVIVPPNPGNLSAFGLLTVDVRNDYVQTQVSPHDILDLQAVTNLYRELTERAAHALNIEGFSPDEHQFARSADLRYFGQAFEVRVPVPNGPFTAEVADIVADRFHDAHRALYGYDFKGDPDQHVEWVNFRATGIGNIQRPELTPAPLSDAGLPEPTSHRQVCFDANQGRINTPIYSRLDLQPGTTFSGPAIIEEFGSTVPIHPGFDVVVDEHRNLIVTREGADS